MKRFGVILKTAALLVVLVGSAVGGMPRDPSELKFDPLVFHMPKAVEGTLGNGTKVLVFENHDLPLVTIAAHVTMGKYYLPVSRMTSVDVLSRLWDEGGAGNHDPAQLDSLVEAMGMTLVAGVGDQEGYVSAFLAREDLQRGAALWRDLLLHPVFDEDRLARAKARKIKDLQSYNDNPNSLARALFWQLMAGPNSAEGKVADKEDIEAVTRNELLALHTRFVTPSNTMIGIAGDISHAEAMDLLNGLLGAWKNDGNPGPPVLIPPERKPQPGVYVLPGDFEQCHVRIGRSLPGLTEMSDEYPAVKLLDFGVGYIRVFYRTRKEGLSYGTGSRLFADHFQGTMMAQGSTRPSKVLDLLRAIREEVSEVGDRPLSDSELQVSRTFQMGSFIRGLETARDVVRLRLQEKTLGLPDGYYQDLIAGEQSVTAAAVETTAKRWMGFGEDPIVLVVGTPEGGPEVLEKLGLGPVHILEPIQFGQ